MPETPSKASIVLETSPKASIILDMPSKIGQAAHCPYTEVVTPELMPKPSTPFSSLLLCHATKAAARITSLLKSSPSTQRDVMAFDDEEEHTIVFDEMAPTPSTLAPSVPNVTPLVMEILPHSDDEQMVVFETEVVTPVCLFPAVPSAAAFVTNSVCDGGYGLDTDVAPRVLVDGESDNDGGKDVLIDVAPSLDTSHDAQTFLYQAYPIPSAILRGHYNTVHLLPPANGPPTLIECTMHTVDYYLGDAAPFRSNSQEKRGYFIGIAEHVGHAMSFKVLTDDTWQIIYRSNIRLAVDSKIRNLHLDPLNNVVSSPIIRFRHDSSHHGEGNAPSDMFIIDPHDLVGHTLLVVLAELNSLQTWSTDIGNAYLEAETKEKVFFVAGPEFGDLAGHTLIIDVLERKYKFKLKGM
jgi:hypothetical protein